MSNTTRRISKQLVASVASCNDRIEFVRTFDKEGDSILGPETHETFHIHVEDGGDYGSSFWFANIHEAHTFAKRMLEACESHGAGEDL